MAMKTEQSVVNSISVSPLSTTTTQVSLENSFTDLGRLVVISYNLHGYNQGLTGLKDMICSLCPDVIMVEEHWLTTDNLYKLSDISRDYFVFGSSAMNALLSQGPLYGRPFGGTAILIHKSHVGYCETLISRDRFTAVLIRKWLLICVYMPSAGVQDRFLIYSDLLQELTSFIQQNSDKKCLIGGDFNTDLDETNPISESVRKFMTDNNLSRLDQLYPTANMYTYYNDSLHVSSKIDYFLTSDSGNTSAFNILDLNINLSDHMPILAVCKYKTNGTQFKYSASSKNVSFLRWDHAPLGLYYEQTRIELQPVFDDLVKLLNANGQLSSIELDIFYNKVVTTLLQCSDSYIPRQKKNFYKFWWSVELDELKEKAIDSATLWKNFGKPHSGPIFQKYKQDKLLYKKRLKDERAKETSVFTNELHEALLRKSGPSFWNCWNSKFKNKPDVVQIDGFIEEPKIVQLFANYFEETCKPFSEIRNSESQQNFEEARKKYCGSVLDKSSLFDVQLLSDIISQMKKGKAAGLDNLTAEHLKYSHPVLISILCRLFNQCLLHGQIPSAFAYSYTVPVPKHDGRSRALSVSDFRGISITAVLSKVFEHAILGRFADYFVTSDHQFGFKKHSSCSHAIYNVRNIVDHYVSRGSTVSACLVDLTKAFDKTNHFELLTKLLHKKFPMQLIQIFTQLFQSSATCAKWGNSFSDFFLLRTGVRQGGVLSPHFFAILIDELITNVTCSKTGCHLSCSNVCIILYADDIILLAPSVEGLQHLLDLCEKSLRDLDMRINGSKSVCIRFGPRHDKQCANLVLSNGEELSWATSCKYLGVNLISARCFKCSFDKSKQAFFRSFNSIYSKIGITASEEVIISLLKAKCMPCLLYAVEACPVVGRDKHSFDFTVKRIFMKLLHTGSAAVVEECLKYFKILPVTCQIDIKTAKFLQRFLASENTICQLFQQQARRQLTSVLKSYDVSIEETAERMYSEILSRFFI